MMIGIDWVVVGRESLFTNLEVIYDSVAPVSKRIKAVVPQTKNSPIMTSRASAASSSVRWFNLPRLAVGGGAALGGRPPGVGALMGVAAVFLSRQS
jgi:hypothetical protein